MGSQAKYLIEGLLKTGKYRFLCLGGAIKHDNYQPQRVAPEQFGDDWTIIPVDGHGSKEIVRQMIDMERPDATVMFTDPRFFYWLWEMEDEIRNQCPLIYWHVWDNDPTPDFNRVFYESTDFISCLSLKTYGIMQDLKYPKDRFNYIPHALPDQLFKPLDEGEIETFKKDSYGPHAMKRFVLMWNNRNARRKQTGDVVASFAGFAKVVGKENVALFMHTQPGDPEGQDVLAVAKKYGVDDALIISDQRVPAELLNKFYNVADCTINIASNEGFGLGTLESLFSGTPILVHMTGGLQFQVGDWYSDIEEFSDQEKLYSVARKRLNSVKHQWFGEAVFPSSRSCTGSQPIPYIYDDRVNHRDVVDGLVRLYRMGRDKRKQLGLRGREWAKQNFSMDSMIGQWDLTLQAQIEKHRSKGNSSRIRTTRV